MSALEPNAVPTPTTLSAFLAGLLLLAYTRRRMLSLTPAVGLCFSNDGAAR